MSHLGMTIGVLAACCIALGTLSGPAAGGGGAEDLLQLEIPSGLGRPNVLAFSPNAKILACGTGSSLSRSRARRVQYPLSAAI